jgi:hypothetical protein
MTILCSISGKQRFYALTLVTLAAAAMRLVPHPWNMTPIAGMALFGGAHFRDHRTAFGVPIAAMLISDLVLALTVYGSAAFQGIPSVYLAFALTVCIGRALPLHPSAVRVGAAAVGAALLFYLITNFAVWMRGALYPMTGQGLVVCYAAALPYLRNAIVGNLVYTAVFFGGFSVAEWRLPELRRESIAHEVGV